MRRLTGFGVCVPPQLVWREDGQPWGTELAQVSEADGVSLTALGEYFVGLAS